MRASLPRLAASIAGVGVALFGGCARTDGGGVGCVGAWCRLDRTVAPPPVEVDPFFAGPGTAFLAARIPARLAAGVDAPDVARSLRLEEAEDAFRAAAPGLVGRDTGTLFVHGIATRLAATPERVAAVLLDLGAEGAALSADEAEVRGATSSAEGARVVGRLGLLRMGEGPFRYDFRWTFVATSRRRTDGVWLVRYDFVPTDAPQRVRVFTGVAVLTPQGGGTLLAELLAVGSSVSPPFFLKGKVRSAVSDLLTQRVRRLAARMEAR